MSPQRVIGLALVPALALWCLWAPERDGPSPAPRGAPGVGGAPRERPPVPPPVAPAGREGAFDGFPGYARDYAPEVAAALTLSVPAVDLSDTARLRPVAAPRYLPGDFSGASPVTGGVGLAFAPVNRWRFGLDLVVRADAWHEDYRPASFSTFLVPAMEYRLNPASPSPVSFGVLTPLSLGSPGAGDGVYFFIRWEELFGGGRRK